MRTFEDIKNIIEAGLGRVPCDLKLANVKLVNVFSAQVYETDIYIKDKRVVSIDPEAGLKAATVMDCRGRYAIPGLIDAHMHLNPPCCHLRRWPRWWCHRVPPPCVRI